MLAQTASDRVLIVTSALRNGEFEKAPAASPNALEEFPKNPQLWMLQGLAHSGKGDQKAALGSYQNALKIVPDYLPALEGAAQLEYEAGSPSAIPLLAARPAVTSQLSHQPCHVGSPRLQEARSCNCCPALRPERFSIRSQEPCRSMARVLWSSGRQKERFLSFRGYWRLIPMNGRARHGLAVVQLAADEPEAAVTKLQPLLAAGDPSVSTMRLAAAAMRPIKTHLTRSGFSTTPLSKIREMLLSMWILRTLPWPINRFTDVTKQAGIAAATDGYGMTVVTADFDEDGWPDIFVACDSTLSLLFMNNHDGTFREEGVMRGFGLSDDGMEQAGMGVGIGDYDLDGHLDLFKTHFIGDTSGFYRNDGKGMFDEVTRFTKVGVETRFTS
jgi:hypothetical protein